MKEWVVTKVEVSEVEFVIYLSICRILSSQDLEYSSHKFIRMNI